MTMLDKPTPLIPAIATVIIALHVHLVMNYGLTGWKGGGFGMFGTIDNGANRALQVKALDRTGTTCYVKIDRTASGPLSPAEIYSTVTFPTDRRLRRVAFAVVNLRLARHEAPSFSESLARSLYAQPLREQLAQNCYLAHDAWTTAPVPIVSVRVTVLSPQPVLTPRGITLVPLRQPVTVAAATASH